MSQDSAGPAAADGVSAAAGQSAGPAAAVAQPLVSVVRGEPTAAELAALTVVVDALLRHGSQSSEPERPDGSRWAAKEQLMRSQLRPGPGAWRSSALPR
jgi:hypothetical protein